MNCKNTKGMKLWQSIDSKWVKNMSIISICVAKALSHDIWGKMKSLTQKFVGGLFQTWSLKFLLVFM